MGGKDAVTLNVVAPFLEGLGHRGASGETGPFFKAGFCILKTRRRLRPGAIF
jgi:hypothetical protein